MSVARRLVVLLLVCVFALTGRPEDASRVEYNVKAAFLLNFTRFIEWPPEAFSSDTAPFNVCILGENPFGAALEQIVRGETVKGHPLAVQVLPRPPEPKACQMLFVNASAKETARMLAEIRPGVLTVGEGPGFLHEGGMIAFVVEDRRVRFDINQRAAANGSLVLSSKLLSVARLVER